MHVPGFKLNNNLILYATAAEALIILFAVFGKILYKALHISVWYSVSLSVVFFIFIYLIII